MSQPTFDAITFTGPDEVELARYSLAEPLPDQLVVQTLYSMVSTGTELRVLGGHYGVAEKYPVIPGYSSVGRVTEVGAEAAGYRVGDLVSCRNPAPVPGVTNYWGGQAAVQVHRSAGENRPVILPAGAEPLDYVTVEISAISLRGVTAADPRPGETAVVVGQGLIGAFSAAWLDIAGCRVVVADREAGRLERAERWAAATVNVSTPDAAQRLATLTDGGADIVVESSGSPRGMETALSLIRARPRQVEPRAATEPVRLVRHHWPRLVVQANYLDTLAVDPFRFFPGEGLTILTPFDRGTDDRQQALDLHRRGDFTARDFIGDLLPYRDAPAAYARLRDDKDNHFSLVFDWTATQ